jgi:opine dehydrogenase
MNIKKIAVLGAGHGGYAAAADLTARGYEVRLHARRQETLDPLREEGGIKTNGIQKGVFPIALATTEIDKAIEGVDLIMLVVPSVAHENYARLLAPLLTPETPIFVNPGHTGGALHFVNELRKAGYIDQVKTCETVTLTYICRKTAPNTVDIFSFTKNLKFAAFPGKFAPEMFELLKPLYPEITLVSSVLETALTNINAVFHAPGMLMNAGWIEDTGGDFLFYREGITPAIGRVIADLDSERMAVAKALGVPTASFLDNFYQAGLTTLEAKESGDISKACYESEANVKIQSPSTLDHRYIHEDVGYGLVPFVNFGRLAGIETPTIDGIIHLTSEMMEIPYLSEGLSLNAMGLSGLDLAAVRRFVEDGE